MFSGLRYRNLREWGLAAVLLWVGMSNLGTPALAQWPEQSCAFAHRIPVTLSATGSGYGDEVRIDLTSSDFPPSYSFSSSGNDIRVFEDDDVTPVSYVIAGWDPVSRSATLYVRPSFISGGTSQTLYIYLGDNSLPLGDSANIVFPDVGVRLRSRVSTEDPTDAASGLAAFQNATVDVDDSVRPTVTGLNNRALGGTNGDFGWCISAVLNVTPATVGTWEFRYGGDFGRGGHLYVSGQALEEDWDDDLWWGGNFSNTEETLSGSITLDEGWHRYEALGFEGCCDGGVGFEARAPGGAWQDLSSANFSLRGAQCVAPNLTVSVGAHESCGTDLTAVKSVDMDGSSPSPYSIPGSIVRYDLTVTNEGQRVDAASLVLTDTFPSDVALLTSPGAFTFSDGTPASGLTFTYSGPGSATDSVEFSTDGTDFSYTPATPTDMNVTHVRFRPAGTFNPNDAGDLPNFTLSLRGEIR